MKTAKLLLQSFLHLLLSSYWLVVQQSLLETQTSNNSSSDNQVTMTYDQLRSRENTMSTLGIKIS